MDSLYEKQVLHSLSIAAAFEFPDGIEILETHPAVVFLIFHRPFFSHR